MSFVAITWRRRLLSATGLCAVLVAAALLLPDARALAQEGQKTVRVEAEKMSIANPTGAQVTRWNPAWGPMASGGAGITFLEGSAASNTYIGTTVTSGRISKVVTRGEAKPQNNCSPNVRLLSSHKRTDGTWGPVVSHGGQTWSGWRPPDLSWRVALEAGQNRLWLQHMCSRHHLFVDYLEYTHEVTPPPNRPVTGVYEGYQDTAGVDRFYGELGGSDGYYPGERYAHEFIDHRYGWPAIGGGVAQKWKDWVAADNAKRRLTVSLPLLPEQSRGDFTGVASGKYDEYFRQFARGLAGTAAEDTIVRLGWEFNGNTFPWSVAGRDIGQYKAAYNRAAGVMRQEAPGLKFEWCPNVTLDAAGLTFDQMYPGDQYVDYIGLGMYDYHWPSGARDPGFAVRWDWLQNSKNGMKDHRDFAVLHGKPMAYTEYGLWSKGYDGGGGDDPQFVRAMAAWFRVNPVAYHVYNNAPNDPNDPRHRHNLDQNYPNAKTAYREEFGG